MKSNATATLVDDPDFLSISKLAARDKVSKQAISKRVKALVASGNLSTRKEGRELLVHVASFDAHKAGIDPAQELRNLAPPAIETSAQPGDSTSTYHDAVKRKALAEAEKAETANAIRRGELLQVEDVTRSAMVIAERMASIVSGMKSRTAELYAAAQSGGEDAFHVALSGMVDGAVSDISGALKSLGQPA